MGTVKRRFTARRLQRWLAQALRMLALAAVLVWSGFPILLVVFSSLRPPRDIFGGGGSLLTLTTRNYTNLWQRWPDFFGNLANSLVVALCATALTLVVSFMAGYVYSRRDGRLLTASAFYMILVRLLPPIVLTLPLFPVIRSRRRLAISEVFSSLDPEQVLRGEPRAGARPGRQEPRRQFCQPKPLTLFARLEPLHQVPVLAQRVPRKLPGAQPQHAKGKGLGPLVPRGEGSGRGLPPLAG